MKLKELKDFLNSLPIEFDEFPIVNGEIFKPENKPDFNYRVDKPIISLVVNENIKEVIFLNDFFEDFDLTELNQLGHDHEKPEI